MGCSSCTSHTDQPKGCKNNGTCGTDGCNKLSVFDWLSDITEPSSQEKFDCVEVRFKNSRKEFFRNSERLFLQIGDVVATEASPGHDIGVVTLTGELVRVQMKKKNADWKDQSLPKIYRKANQHDIDIWQEVRAREDQTQKQSRELALQLGLKMKISDVEYQGDGSKAVFYYTAEERVDFRQLIKDMARTFSIRIEMRQIGFRQEAARLGGVGSCGRELCCSTWLSDFRSVTTAAARYQQLSLNPQKLAGQCGKLKCCLNYELDTYLDALKEFPRTDTTLFTEKGKAYCQKIDIFKGLMWFTYENDPMNWHKLAATKVNEIIAINQNKQKIESLEEYEIKDEIGNSSDFKDSLEQDSLTRFDQPIDDTAKKKRKKRKRKPATPPSNSNNSKRKSDHTKGNPKPKQKKSDK